MPRAIHRSALTADRVIEIGDVIHGRINLLEAAQTEATQDHVDGRERRIETAERSRASSASGDERLDCGNALDWSLMRAARAGTIGAELRSEEPDREA